MGNMKANETLDATGLACPMPIVQTKRAMETLQEGDVLEVRATDPGSEADIKAWAKNAGHQYLGTTKTADILTHYLRKITETEKSEKTYTRTINNEQLEEKLHANESITVIDVREAAEYAFNHIQEAKNIPLGELEQKSEQLSKTEAIYVICRTGNRSDLAAKQLTALGFEHVYNVVPGMTEWTGTTKKI